MNYVKHLEQQQEKQQVRYEYYYNIRSGQIEPHVVGSISIGKRDGHLIKVRGY